MSISRKNWSALSSLSRQWSREDEEEAERERRRRVRGSSSAAEPGGDVSPTPGDTPTGGGASETDARSGTSQGLSSLDQVDFVEMLRLRDEKRRKRHVETLRRQKELEEDDAGLCRGGGGEGARVELLGELEEDQGKEVPRVKSKPPRPPKPAPHNPASSIHGNVGAGAQHENGESSGKNPEPESSSNPTRKFVSSLSISLDQSPSTSGPRTPTAPVSPPESSPPPCHSPSPRGAQSPVQNGNTQESDVPSNGDFEQTSRPAFVRHSSRTVSFRMMRKKEQETAPLQRSASVRMASKKFESNADQNKDEDKASSFQRNSRQRISARSIQEKMERLTQAAQKSETPRSPDVTQRTLFLMDEVSRRRGLFEKEQPAPCPTSPGISRQEFRSFTSGVSDRINRWLNRTNQTGSSQSPADLRHVGITAKRSMFESSGEDTVPKSSLEKIHK